MKIFDPGIHRVEPRRSPGRIAVLSVDVEHDYGGERTEALEQLPTLLAAVREAGLPLSAFVEGRLFDERPDLCAALLEAEADLHLHCHDHRRPGDDAASLRAGAAAFTRFAGRRPTGYRAHTFRLTEEVFAALVAEGFAWDSSILPGFGIGNRREAVFRRGDYFALDETLFEYPVAGWRRAGIPFIHSYRQLLGPRPEALLDRVARLPDLLIYDMHLVDLTSEGRIGETTMPAWLKSAHRLARRRSRGFEELPLLGERFRRRGYRWTTMTACHRLLAGNGR